MSLLSRTISLIFIL